MNRRNFLKSLLPLSAGFTLPANCSAQATDIPIRFKAG